MQKNCACPPAQDMRSFLCLSFCSLLRAGNQPRRQILEHLSRHNQPRRRGHKGRAAGDIPSVRTMPFCDGRANAVRPAADRHIPDNARAVFPKPAPAPSAHPPGSGQALRRGKSSRAIRRETCERAQSPTPEKHFPASIARRSYANDAGTTNFSKRSEILRRPAWYPREDAFGGIPLKFGNLRHGLHRSIGYPRRIGSPARYPP